MMCSLTFFFYIILYISSFQTSSLAQHIYHGYPHIRPRQATSGPYPATGVIGSGIQPRREIRDLQANYPDQFNVYLLGLQRMQSMTQSDMLSYYQIAGIHGVPEKPWNGVSGVSNPSSSGFCTHLSILFLTWHRPYMALFEQLLIQNAQAAANQFPPGFLRDRYLTAAALLRAPYWDWAASPQPGLNSIPDFMISETIQLIVANGTTTVVKNPLYSYNFHPLSAELQYSPYINWPSTLRWPASTAANAQTQNDALINSVNRNQPTMKTRLYALLTQMTQFSDFGDGSSPNHDSMETVHNQLHTAVGGPNFGHMTAIAASAFDPSFWLHHVMVDRSFAIWQALWPQTYVTSQKQTYGTYWYNSGSFQGPDSALKPFYSDRTGKFWTSNAIRNISTLGYTYPELQSGNRQDVLVAVTKLYQPTTSTTTRKSKRNIKETEPQQNNNIEYWIQIRAPTGAIQAFGYHISFFIGAPPTSGNIRAFLTLGPSYISSEYIPSTSLPGSQPQRTSLLIGGSVPLNDHLAALVDSPAYPALTDLSPEQVVPFLQTQLQWAISTQRDADNGAGGSTAAAAAAYENVAPEMLPGLRIEVVSREMVSESTDSSFPTYSAWLRHPEITVEKPGGVGIDELALDPMTPLDLPKMVSW